MKNKFLYIIIDSVVVACGTPDKKAELEKLRTQNKF